MLAEKPPEIFENELIFRKLLGPIHDGESVQLPRGGAIHVSYKRQVALRSLVYTVCENRGPCERVAGSLLAQARNVCL